MRDERRKPSAWTALLVTILYWAGVIVAVLVTPNPGWLDLRWPVAIYFFAIPATVILWLCWFAAWWVRPLRHGGFAVVGISLPIICAAYVWGVGPWLENRQQARLEDQMGLATLDAINDEPLFAARGPIGLRVRYRVTYPKGLDMDEGHGAFAVVKSSYGHEFIKLRSIVIPKVSNVYAPGSYDFTEEFVPPFVPLSLLVPDLRKVSSDRCFRWNKTGQRHEALEADAQVFTITIYLHHEPLPKVTTHAYRLADFYETALKAGAVECVPANM